MSPTYVETQCKDVDGKTQIPDGVIVVERGKKQWRALVEVKMGTGELTTEQAHRCIDICNGSSRRAGAVAGDLSLKADVPDVVAAVVSWLEHLFA